METIFMNTENGKTNEPYFYQIKVITMMKFHDQSDEINLNWISIPNHPYRILVIGGSGSGKLEN